MIDNYEDIINLPHHVSTKHPHMTRAARAAQFAPFAALTGHSDAIKETARLTTKRVELDDNQKTILNNKLNLILDNIQTTPEATFTYFTPDIKKEGGQYISITGNVKKIDITNNYVLLTNKTKIPLKEIININSNLFNNYEE